MTNRTPGPDYSPTFCIVPFLEVSMETSGRFCLCNDSVPPPPEKMHRHKIHLGMPEDEIARYWNSNYLKEVRKKMLAGETLSECRVCYEQESIGKSSKRMRENHWWNLKEFEQGILDAKKNYGQNSISPVYLHLRFGNLCNLKCRMCFAATSSSIFSEGKQLEKTYNISEFETYNFPSAPQTINKDWENSPEFMDQILAMTPNLRHICITGGEPSLAKPFYHFLRECIKNNSAKNIHLSVFTNLTTAPDEYIELLNQFKAVELHASIDGFGSINEYIRYPSNWATTENNFFKWRSYSKNSTVKIWFTLQAYNILYLEPLLEWVRVNRIPLNIGLAINPDHLHIRVLPPRAKDFAIEKMEHYIRITQGLQLNHGMTAESQFRAFQNMLSKKEPYSNELGEKFIRYTKMLDIKRKQSFEKTCPELANFFHAHFLRGRDAQLQ